jgi:hypothetical protein
MVSLLYRYDKARRFFWFGMANLFWAFGVEYPTRFWTFLMMPMSCKQEGKNEAG